RLAPCGQFRGDPPGPVAPPMLPEDLPHEGSQPGIFLLPGAGAGSDGRVVAGPTGGQRLTHGGHGGALTLPLCDPALDPYLVPCLKMAKAFFRMSRSRSVRRSRSSSCRTLISSAEAARPSWPRTSAFQRYSSEVFPMPRF